MTVFCVPQTFVDNFQTAKQAISIATAQAAEKAAASVKDFALKSFRLSVDITLKAPLIIIPQSSISQNAFVVDLGLITMNNTFSLTPAKGFPLPAVVETMDVKLTHLKLLRYYWGNVLIIVYILRSEMFKGLSSWLILYASRYMC